MIRKRRGWRPPWRRLPQPTGRRRPSPSIGWQSQAIRWSWTSPWRHPHRHPSPRRGCWRQISKCTQHVSRRYRLGSSTSCWRIRKLPRTNEKTLPSLSPQCVPWTTFATQIWTACRISWIGWGSSHAPVLLVWIKKIDFTRQSLLIFQREREERKNKTFFVSRGREGVSNQKTTPSKKTNKNFRSDFLCIVLTNFFTTTGRLRYT